MVPLPPAFECERQQCPSWMISIPRCSLSVSPHVRRAEKHLVHLGEALSEHRGVEIIQDGHCSKHLTV